MTTREMLEAVASNLWWSWNPEAREVFDAWLAKPDKVPY